MMPRKLYSDAAYFFTWLLGYSILMGALGGILIADYWVLRKQQLDVNDLFREQGRYTYRNGVNMRAVAALVLAILPVVMGFIRAVSVPGGTVADPNFFDRLYSYAWFVTFALSFGCTCCSCVVSARCHIERRRCHPEPAARDLLSGARTAPASTMNASTSCPCAPPKRILPSRTGAR